MTQPYPSAQRRPHAEAFREVWLARYPSLTAAAKLAQAKLDAAGDDERLRLRMQLVLQRLAPPSADAAARYHALADRMQALDDRPGYLIAKSFAAGAEGYLGDAAAALAAYEQLGPEIDLLPDPLEQHVAIS